MTSTRTPQAARQADAPSPTSAEWLTDWPDVTTAALLISTDDAGIERLLRDQAWGPLTVSPEHLGIDQLLFLNRDTGEISHLALLNATTPFRPVQNRTGTAAGTAEPVIALVDELLEPLSCDAALLQVQETLLGIALPAETTPLLIADVDALYGSATACGDADQSAESITAAIVDQLIRHQRKGGRQSDSQRNSNAAAA